MNLKLQTKLYLGFSFLFLIIVIIWVFSSVYIFKLSSDSDAMLRDNYKSVVAMKDLSIALDEMKDIQSEFFFHKPSVYMDSTYLSKIRDFEKNLRAEENNITEPGEKELVALLTNSFYEYTNHFTSIRNDSLNVNKSYFFDLLQEYREVKKYITGISDLNMEAIIKKNDRLKESSNKAFMYISIMGTVFFLISFSILMNFPRNIADPVKELTKGIREIARKNYDQQLHINSKDEFGELAKAFNTMAVKLNEFETSNLYKILFEKKRIESIISNIKDAVIGLDEKKEIIFSNPVACDLLGMNVEDLTGKHIDEIAMKNDLFRNITKDLQNDTYKSKEFNPLKIISGGKESYFIKDILDVYTTAKDEHGQQLIGHLIILKNITKFQELDDAKTNFIATVSHELKNPISSARLNLKLLEDPRVGEMNEEQKELLKNVRDEVNRLLKITGELLDLSQVESGNIQLEVNAMDPHDIIDYALHAVKYQAETKKIAITLDIPSELPPIIADAEKTAWVLTNFLNNAIHYSGENSSIILSARKEDKEIQFSVKDFGKGIEEKYLDKIFERFFRVPGASKSGTGLGLAISKEFITKQKGRIWVESKPEEGSTFYFTLPLA
jgi:two-component system, NtrC family, sensor histidine kinase KinB